MKRKVIFAAISAIFMTSMPSINTKADCETTSEKYKDRFCLFGGSRCYVRHIDCGDGFEFKETFRLK